MDQHTHSQPDLPQPKIQQPETPQLAAQQAKLEALAQRFGQMQQKFKALREEARTDPEARKRLVELASDVQKVAQAQLPGLLSVVEAFMSLPMPGQAVPSADAAHRREAAHRPVAEPAPGSHDGVCKRVARSRNLM
jgi:uncharacterized protein (DUF885 family)